MATKPTVNVLDDRIEIHCQDWELTPVVIGPPLQFGVTDEKGQRYFFRGERASKFLRHLQDVEGIDLAEMFSDSDGAQKMAAALHTEGVTATFHIASEPGKERALKWDDEETVLYDAQIAFLDPEKIGLLRVCISENEIFYINEQMQSKQYDGVYDRSVDCLVDLNCVAESLDEDDALRWAVFFEGLAAKLRSNRSVAFNIRPVAREGVTRTTTSTSEEEET